MPEPNQCENRGPVERDIQHYLANNLSFALEEELTLVGSEYPVPFGRIDILAQDSRGSLVAIELKLGTATRDAIGQLQSYMGALRAEHPDTFVRGIVVATSLDAAAEAALTVTRDILFTSYAVTFKFVRRIETASTYAEWEARTMTPPAQTDAPRKKLWLPPSFQG